MLQSAILSAVYLLSPVLYGGGGVHELRRMTDSLKEDGGFGVGVGPSDLEGGVPTGPSTISFHGNKYFRWNKQTPSGHVLLAPTVHQGDYGFKFEIENHGATHYKIKCGQPGYYIKVFPTHPGSPVVCTNHDQSATLFAKNELVNRNYIYSVADSCYLSEDSSANAPVCHPGSRSGTPVNLQTWSVRGGSSFSPLSVPVPTGANTVAFMEGHIFWSWENRNGRDSDITLDRTSNPEGKNFKFIFEEAQNEYFKIQCSDSGFYVTVSPSNALKCSRTGSAALFSKSQLDRNGYIYDHANSCYVVIGNNKPECRQGGSHGDMVVFSAWTGETLGLEGSFSATAATAVPHGPNTIEFSESNLYFSWHKSSSGGPSGEYVTAVNDRSSKSMPKFKFVFEQVDREGIKIGCSEPGYYMVVIPGDYKLKCSNNETPTIFGVAQLQDLHYLFDRRNHCFVTKPSTPGGRPECSRRTMRGDFVTIRPWNGNINENGNVNGLEGGVRVGLEEGGPLPSRPMTIAFESQSGSSSKVYFKMTQSSRSPFAINLVPTANTASTDFKFEFLPVNGGNDFKIRCGDGDYYVNVLNNDTTLKCTRVSYTPFSKSVLEKWGYLFSSQRSCFVRRHGSNDVPECIHGGSTGQAVVLSTWGGSSATSWQW